MVTINSEVYSTGVIANYTCDPGYVLAGNEMRTCEERYGGTVGTWTGHKPHCQSTYMHENSLYIIIHIYIIAKLSTNILASP